eukprot:2205757-Rhodomonas_salina.1
MPGSDAASGATSGKIYEIEKLVTMGANIHCVEMSAMHTAAKHGRCAAIALLVAKGADINLQDDSDQTPLHVAAQEGHLAAMFVLLELGAATDAVDGRGFTPMHSAAKEGRQEAMRVLLR